MLDSTLRCSNQWPMGHWLKNSKEGNGGAKKCDE